MEKSIYERSAELKAQIKTLTAELKEIDVIITENMLNDGEEKKVFNYGTFTITGRKSWTYSSAVEDKAAELKELKGREEQTGVATFEETKSIRFTPKKDEE